MLHLTNKLLKHFKLQGKTPDCILLFIKYNMKQIKQNRLKSLVFFLIVTNNLELR